MKSIIKKIYAHYIIAGIVAVLLVTTTVCVLLMHEYFFFKHQAEKLLELKEEYRSYVVAVKKIVDEYNQAQEQDNSTQENSEKKKGADDLKESFVVVNRDQLYLKQSMIDFCDAHESIRPRINLNEWRDYNEQLMENASNKKRASTRGKRQRIKSQQQVIRPKSSMPDGKRDINLAWPVENSNFWLSSFFGPRKQPNGTWGFHYGIDMAALKGTPVKAAYAGMVVEATHGAGFGKTIVVMHNNKYKTRYAHLNTILVRIGQKVAQGEVIGKVGDTGIVRSKSGRDPSHLHFEVYKFGKRVNPMYYLV